MAQPANTVSNLGFVAVGLAIAAVSDRRGRAPRSNRLRRHAAYPIAFSGENQGIPGDSTRPAAVGDRNPGKIA